MAPPTLLTPLPPGAPPPPMPRPSAAALAAYRPDVPVLAPLPQYAALPEIVRAPPAPSPLPSLRRRHVSPRVVADSPVEITNAGRAYARSMEAHGYGQRRFQQAAEMPVQQAGVSAPQQMMMSAPVNAPFMQATQLLMPRGPSPRYSPPSSNAWPVAAYRTIDAVPQGRAY